MLNYDQLSPAQKTFWSVGVLCRYLPNIKMEDSNRPGPAARTGSGVTNSALYLVYFVAFMDLFAVSMLAPLLRKQSLDSGNSYTTAGIIGSVYGATQLFSSPLVGDWWVFGKEMVHCFRALTVFLLISDSVTQGTSSVALINQSIDQSINQSINQSISSSIISSSINQSINQTL